MANQQQAISKQTAFEIARKTVAELKSNEPLKLLEDKTVEKDFGWVFFYNTKRFLETHDRKYMMPGNAPFVVEREDGSVHFLFSSVPPNQAIEKYEKEWREKKQNDKKASPSATP